MPNFTDSKTASKGTDDLQVFGNPDQWVLIAKASSYNDGWMKSTKAMNVMGMGVVIQTCAEFRDKTGNVTACSESTCFVPRAKVVNSVNGVPMLVSFD